VSLSPNNTEILYALGLGSRIAGVTRYCTYPPQAKFKPKVGDMSMSTETIIALRPDLILAHATLHDSLIPKLEKLGFKVFAVDPKSLTQTIAAIRAIGRITDTLKKAENIAQKMETQLQVTVKKHKSNKSHRVLIVVQAHALWAAGPKTIPDEMLSILNAKNVAFDARAGFVTFSEELAVARNPEVIIAGTELDAAYFRKSSVWRSTSALKNNKVIVIDPDLLVRPAPRLISGLQILASKLDF
jgi:iron complex transport system substrate-binding protein